MQFNFLFFDWNCETFNLNRQKGERLPDYIQRVLTDTIISETNCWGMDDMMPCKFKQYNEKIKTYDHTYYFAIATGERKKLKNKAREIFKEPKNVIRDSCGYNTNVTQDIKYRNSHQRLARRDKNNPVTSYEMVSHFFKIALNVLSLCIKESDEYHHKDLFLNHLNNRLNPSMNNLMAIDHASREWIDDHDMILPRHTEEFPRLASNYQSKHRNNKPWGDQNDPVYLNPFLDENQVHLSEGSNYEKGVWYYTGYPMTDHHDLAGLPSFLRDI
jgi:hypothetical protein